MNKTFELIDKYFRGDLSNEEKKQVEQKIAQDHNFQNEYYAYQHSKNAIEQVIEKDLRESLKTWQANDGQMMDAPAHKAQIITLRRFLAIAASITVLIGLSTFIWFGRQYDAKHLANHYYQAEDLNVFRSATNGADPVLAPGLTLLKEKKYAKALVFFDDLSQQADYQDIARYYRGSTLYLQKKFIPARSTLLELAARTTAPNLKDRAEWLALLSCLNQQPIREDCLTTLQSICANANHSYHQPAIRLNNSLNSWVGKLFN